VEPNHLSDWAESRKSRPGGRLFAMPGCKLRQAHELPPDCTCDACGRAIGASEPRQRCASNSCDDMHLCIACAATACACPTCGASSGRLYRDRASPFVLRSLLFREAFDAHADSADVVHPQRMVARAFAVYAERPLLGEAASDGSSVQWWSYADCGAAARTTASTAVFGRPSPSAPPMASAGSCATGPASSPVS
jgi:hypothetical protein